MATLCGQKSFRTKDQTLTIPRTDTPSQLHYCSSDLTKLLHAMVLLSFIVGSIMFFFRGKAMFTGSNGASS